jgi:rhamnose transport system permease protein
MRDRKQRDGQLQQSDRRGLHALAPDAVWGALLGAGGVIIVITAVVTTPSFLTEYNATLGSTTFSYIALMSLPMTCVIIAGEIDLSVGAVMGLGMAVLARAIDAGLPAWAAILAAIGAAALCGALNGTMVAFLGIPSLVLTIGTLALFSGLQLGLLGPATFVRVPAWVITIGQGTAGASGVPIALLVVTVAALLLWLALTKLRVGSDIYSIGCNRLAAERTGIKVKLTIFWLFVVSGLFAGIAGLLYVGPIASINADVGANVELTVIATVLLGGIDVFGGQGRVQGVFLAIVIMGLLSDVMVLHQLTSTVQSLITGGLLIGAVVGPTALRLRGTGRGRAPTSSALHPRARRHAPATMVEARSR